MKQLIIFAFTEKGKSLAAECAEALQDTFETEVFEKGRQGESAAAYLGENFQKKDVFLFISAAGIAVRMIAPLIKSKDVDPAVIVMDELGRHVVPILSGHLGGANAAAEKIAKAAGAELVLTTATDINEKFAVDVWASDLGCRIFPVENIKYVSSAVLRGEKVGFSSDFGFSGELPEELTLDTASVGISVSLDLSKKPFEKTLHVIPQVVTLGIGCRKGQSPEVFEEFILDNLKQAGVAIESICRIASIDLKKEEPCILAFSEKYQIPFVTYTAEELMAAEGEFIGSDLVRKVTGADNVCERSAYLASAGGRIILDKTGGMGCTCALAMKEWECKF